jgi:hypothetical protein
MLMGVRLGISAGCQTIAGSLNGVRFDAEVLVNLLYLCVALAGYNFDFLGGLGG